MACWLDRRSGRVRWRWCAGLLGLVWLSGCGGEPRPSVPEKTAPSAVSPAAVSSNRPSSPLQGIAFVDRTAASGVRFTYQNDEEHSDYAILESLGGGVAIFDFDADGRADLFLPGGGAFWDRTTTGRPSALFRNVESWQFVDVTATAGIERSPHYSHGAAVADFDEDGFDDVLVTGYGGVTLYHNRGDGSFDDVSSWSGLDDRMWSSSAAWGDLNGDGVVDLYVAHYVDWSFDKNIHCPGPRGQPRDVCPPRQFEGLPDSIYFGNSDGTFRDATTEAGLRTNGKGLGVVLADLDADGDLDIYVTNDTVPNFVYGNDGHGHFEDLSQSSGAAVSEKGTPDGSMGVDVGDFNGDGLPDIWVSNYEHEVNALYRNLGHNQFRHVSLSTGIAAVGATYVGWGTRFIDADLDGDEDLIVANGHVIRYPDNSPRRQRPLLLENAAGARFVNASETAGDYFVASHEGRGLATGDLDGDGDEDVVISNLNEPAAVLSNESSPKRNWLAVRIIGRKSARSAIGAVAVARMGDRSLTRMIRGGGSFASTNRSVLHFGLGEAAQVDQLTVTWNSGTQSVLRDLTSNQTLTIIEPDPERQ